MDLVTGGELEYHLHNRGRFAFSWVRFFVGAITLALEYLHGHCIVYRDLKLENVLLDSEGGDLDIWFLLFFRSFTQIFRLCCILS